MEYQTKISEEHERIIEQFKYLLSVDTELIKQQLLNLLNKLQPFNQFPLGNLPPIQFFQTDKQAKKIITQDLKTQLVSYCFIVLRGRLTISKQNYQFTEEKYLDEQNIREKSVYNFDQGKSRMTANQNTVYLKIHSIWVKKAKKKFQDKQKQYIKNKLISLDFFSQLTFQQFDQCFKKAYIQKYGPQQIVLKQNQIPYHMYIVAQGQLSLQKRVKFSKQDDVWNEVKTEIKKNDTFCSELFQYLVRQPKAESPYFEIDFNLKQVHEGQIICAKQTLLQQPLDYTIRSTLKTKLICIKYPDLYVLSEQKLSDIRHWPFLFEIDTKQLRRQYYSLVNWTQFKAFLSQQNRLSQIQKMSFDSYLRKDINLNSKRYNFCTKKITEGKIVQSPAGKVFKMKSLSIPQNQKIQIQ